MKKVLIIGAGFLQNFMIQKARKMGYYTLAVDADPSAIGFAFADEHEVINIIDKEACLAYARKKQIDGVLTAATEYGVLTASYIAQEMNLPGLEYAVAKRVKDKYLVKKCFIENHVDDFNGEAHEVDASTDIQKLAQNIHYPVVVKPCDGSGSRGTRRVDCNTDLRDACDFATSCSHTHRALIEPFIDGQEYGAESLVVNGEIHVLAIMKKWMTQPPYYAELGHAIPCGLPIETETKAKKCIENSIRALGIRSGAVNSDFLITAEGKVYIVDIGARMGGNLIGTCIIPYGTGIDYMGAILQTALGEPVDFTVHQKSAVASKLLAFHDGVVNRLPDFEKIQRMYDVEIYHHMKLHDTVHEYHTNLDGLGYLVAKGETVEEATEKTTKAFKYLSEEIF